MYNQIPFMMPGTNAAGLATKASLLGKINWSSLLTNAQKTLNVVNQAVPLYYQIKPVFKNIRTIGKIGKEFAKIGNNNQNIGSANSLNNEVSNNIVENNNYTSSENDNEDIPTPTFFI